MRGLAVGSRHTPGEGDEPFHSLRHAAFRFGVAAMQMAHTGSLAQVERTVAILNEARAMCT